MSNILFIGYTLSFLEKILCVQSLIRNGYSSTC